MGNVDLSMYSDDDLDAMRDMRLAIAPQPTQADPNSYDVNPLLNTSQHVINSIANAGKSVGNGLSKASNLIGQGLSNAPSAINNGLGQLVQGFQDNYNNGLTNGDWYKEQTSQPIVDDPSNNPVELQTASKSGLTRLGEALGTGARVLNNPYVQGGIAGIAYGADKDNALYGLGKGVEWAGNKAISNMYANKLGINPTIFGNLSSKDYKAITDGDYRNRKLTQDQAIKSMNWVRQMENAGQINPQTAKEMLSQIMFNLDLKDVNVLTSNQTRKTNEYINNNEFNRDLNSKKLSETIRHNKTTEGISSGNLSEKTRHNKTTENLIRQRFDTKTQQGRDLSGYYKVKEMYKNDPTTLKLAKQRYIERYGVDPDKLLVEGDN